MVLAMLGACATSSSIHLAAPSGAPARAPLPAKVLPSSRVTPSALKPTVRPGIDTGGAKPTPSGPGSDGVPLNGSGSFSVSPGGTAVVGDPAATRVTYVTEVEKGIAWGSNPVWTPTRFAATVDAIIAGPRGWTASNAHPITDHSQGITNGSWSFQRVSGGHFNVKILLATPGTTDRLCGTAGLRTLGQYSCRYGNTMVINLRRWLRGAPGFAMSLDGYHTMVINHEMGHRLGFDHMLCPGRGQPAPVMQEETIDLAGCVPNAYPFAANGTFITGPWASS